MPKKKSATKRIAKQMTNEDKLLLRLAAARYRLKPTKLVRGAKPARLSRPDKRLRYIYRKLRAIKDVG